MPGAGTRTARVVTVRAFAKINLGLRVKGLRPDGYHELQTVFQTIALADTLTFRACDGPFRLSSTRDDVPVDERNLVWRAAAALWDALGRPSRPGGVAVAIRKRIPPMAGLGGGSADAAAALLALARLWRVRVPAATLDRLGAALGADVPFFLCGGTALGLGRGDEIYPMADLPPSTVVVAYPSFGVPTSDAFRWFDAECATHGTDVGAGRAQELGAATWRPDAARVVNDLEPTVVRRHPSIGRAIQRLRDGGATVAAMSGSGSGVFGLFPDARRASQAAAGLAGIGWTAHATRTLTRREASRRFPSPARPRRGPRARRHQGPD